MAANPTENEDSARPVIVVTGPTASGKSDLAIRIAGRFGGEVINADSMQVYRYMDIGTAKPSLEERAIVPHHLFDVVPPDADYNAGRYAVDARAAAAEIHDRGAVPVVTGGTGLYIRAFLHGLVATGGPDSGLRESLEREHERATAEGEPDRLHARLKRLDEAAAAKIHPNDLRRTIRALEILHQTERSASTVRSAHGFDEAPFRSLHFAVDPGREVLAERIDQRCDRMIESGLLQEVRALRDRGYGAELKSMQSIGYRHIQPVVDGSDTLANALEAMKGDTRRFARRQRTWLRKVKDVIWTEPEREASVMQAVEEHLAGSG